MKKQLYTFLLLLLALSSCYKEDDFTPSQLSEVINLRIENNNQLADGYSTVKVIAEFPADFATEQDNKVSFVIDNKEIEENIRLVEIAGVNKKIAETYISSKAVKTSNIKAIISIQQSEISKDENISFIRAFGESIKLSSPVIKISPDSSFATITLTTKLGRGQGVPSIGTTARTQVVDSNGIERGAFVNYNEQTDSAGTISNQFTMANDTYTGKLYAISESLNAANNTIKDTLILYAQN